MSKIGTIPNDRGAIVRAHINDATVELATWSAGATAPSPAHAHMLWVDTGAGRIWRRNAENTAWVVAAVLDAGGTVTWMINGAPPAATATAKANLTAATAPTSASDSTAGYAPGSLWLHPATTRAWICITATPGGAVWLPVSASVFGTTTAGLVPAPGTGHASRLLTASGAWVMPEWVMIQVMDVMSSDMTIELTDAAISDFSRLRVRWWNLAPTGTASNMMSAVIRVGDVWRTGTGDYEPVATYDARDALSNAQEYRDRIALSRVGDNWHPVERIKGEMIIDRTSSTIYISAFLCYTRHAGGRVKGENRTATTFGSGTITGVRLQMSSVPFAASGRVAIEGGHLP